MKKLIALLLCVCLLLSAAACTNAPAADKSTDASNQDGEQRLRIVATLQSQQINFWSNVQHTLERLAKEENVDLTIMDLNGDVTTFANVIDDIVAMKPDGVYVYCTVEGDMPYGTFIAEGQRRQREVLERGTLTEDGDVRSFFFVSSVPWVHYSQLQHPAESPDDSNPRISWGKYVTVNGRTTLPVSLFVNHALADGLHISRFFLNLEKELADMTRQWNESKKDF